MTAIYKRELKTFFTTVTGWLFIAAHICLAGLYFFAINLLSGYSNVGQSFSSILFCCCYRHRFYPCVCWQRSVSRKRIS